MNMKTKEARKNCFDENESARITVELGEVKWKLLWASDKKNRQSLLCFIIAW